MPGFNRKHPRAHAEPTYGFGAPPRDDWDALVTRLAQYIEEADSYEHVTPHTRGFVANGALAAVYCYGDAFLRPSSPCPYVLALAMAYRQRWAIPMTIALGSDVHRWADEYVSLNHLARR